MKPQKKKIDPKKKRYEAKYDARAGYYPVGVRKNNLQRREYFSADDAPKEASRLNLDQRLTDAIFEISDEMGAKEIRTDYRINKYLDKSREYLSNRIAKSMNSKAKPFGNASQGETEFIPKLDKVVDKLSTLSDSEMESLKKEVLRLSKQYKGIDKDASTSSKMSSAISIAANQDWSKLKPIREKAGLTRDDLISLIQAPSDAGFLTKTGFSAARAALGMKDFKNGGKVFKPHNMYKNGKAVMAKTMEDHLRLKKQGYTHKK
jgi:hypothetical protein